MDFKILDGCPDMRNGGYTKAFSPGNPTEFQIQEHSGYNAIMRWLGLGMPRCIGHFAGYHRRAASTLASLRFANIFVGCLANLLPYFPSAIVIFASFYTASLPILPSQTPKVLRVAQ